MRNILRELAAEQLALDSDRNQLQAKTLDSAEPTPDNVPGHVIKGINRWIGE